MLGDEVGIDAVDSGRIHGANGGANGREKIGLRNGYLVMVSMEMTRDYTRVLCFGVIPLPKHNRKRIGLHAVAVKDGD